MKDYVFERDAKLKLEEMSNIRPDKTGLKMVIWVFPYTGKEGHWARIKVSKHYGNKVSSDLFSVTIDDNPTIKGNTGDIELKDLNKVISFIKKNKKTLLKVWNDEIDLIDAVTKFKRIR